MTDTTDPQGRVPPELAGKCDPAEPIGSQKFVLPRPSPEPDTPEPRPRAVSFNIVDPVRRKARMAQKAMIPAGYTYFAQLIGHDIGNSVRLGSVPHAMRAPLTAPQAGPPPVLYNLIENPLTLETLYGPGPTLLHHVFDPGTFLFRTSREETTSLQFQGPQKERDLSVRALYDSRNRDTTFLHRLSVILMKFHNYIARDIRDARGEIFWNKRGEIYSTARAHVLAVWHDVIRHDFLPTFVDPACLPAARYSMPTLDDTTLLHGVFRAFHALPLSNYFMDHQLRALKMVLRQGLAPASLADKWGMDWANFFVQTENPNKTGLSATMSDQLTGRNGLSLTDLDLSTSRFAQPLRLGDDTIRRAVKVLHPEDAARLEPAAFAQAVNGLFGVNSGPQMLVGKHMKWMPLFATLMLEADLYGTQGRFGPLGGLLLTHMMERLLDRVVGATPAPYDLARPRTMYEIIQFVEQRENNENA